MEQEYHSFLFDIRPVDEADKELFGAVVQAEYVLSKLYNIDPALSIKLYWETIINDKEDKNYSVFLNNGDFLGRVALQGINQDIPELAIIIVEKYQGQGYGEKLLKEWLNWVQKTFGYSRINVRIDNTNEKSKKLFQKLKAVIDYEGDIIYCHIDLPL